MKVTKSELMSAAGCQSETVVRLWPKRRRKLSMLEVVQIAEKYNIKPDRIQYIVWLIDNVAWNKVFDEHGDILGSEGFYPAMIEVYTK